MADVAATKSPPAAAAAAASARLASLPRRVDAFLRDADAVSPLAAATAAVEAGRVSVRGATVRDPDTLVWPRADAVALDGAVVAPRLVRRRTRCWAFFKPARMKTDMSGPLDDGGGGRAMGMRAAARAVPGLAAARAQPIGQLDVGTTGLMLFTDDGELARLVNWPGACAKEYVVGFERPDVAGRDPLTPAQLAALRAPAPESEIAGAPCFDQVAAPRRVGRAAALRAPPPGCAPKAAFETTVAIRSGQNHVVKRQFARVGVAVRTLRREAVGPVSLEGLGLRREGEWRRLGARDVAMLWAAVGGFGALEALKHAQLRKRPDVAGIAAVR